MRSAAIFFLDKAEPISTRDTSNESIIPEQEKRRDDMRAVVLVPVLKQQRENRDAAAEDFKDETRAVDDLGIPLLFEISLLHRGQRMIDDHQAGIRLIEQMADFLDLAGSEQCRPARR